MNQAFSSPRIRNATASDLPKIRELLISANLPTEGIENHLRGFLIAEVNGEIAGTIGLEIYKSDGLLRSALVVPAHQNKGIGTKLVDTILLHARKAGVKKIFLLTDTAERYFRKKGFTRIERNIIEGEILTSTEFSGACPLTAVCMKKIL